MAYDYFNKPTSLGYLSRTKRTLDDLEKDENFLEVSERFLGSIGRESDDVFEYLRDSDFNLVSGMSRAIESGKFNEQEKQDYAYLRREFDNADLGSLKQFAGLVKDASIDKSIEGKYEFVINGFVEKIDFKNGAAALPEDMKSNVLFIKHETANTANYHLYYIVAGFVIPIPFK